MPDRKTLVARSGPRAGLGAVLVLLACTPSPADSPSPSSVRWRTDLDSALAESRSRDLPVWLQFTGPWCPNCRRMEQGVFADAAVVASTRDRLVPVKLRSDEYESYAVSLGLSVLPSTVLLHPDGSVIARQEGYADAPSFRAFLDRSLKESGWTERLARRTSRGAEASGDEIALAGYCPVTLVKGRRLQEGQSDLTVRYEGRAFRFANASDRDAFLKEPEAYLPVNRGLCPVRRVDRGESTPGDPHFGLLYRGRLYLCADATARDRFLKDPGRYAEADVEDHGFCPHCRNESGLLVRGVPRFSATHRGRRYLFPDSGHLEAFRADPEKFVR